MDDIIKDANLTNHNQKEDNSDNKSEAQAQKLAAEKQPVKAKAVE
jgi:hypothetical protein